MRDSGTCSCGGSIAGGFAVAFGPAFAANRYLIRRGKGHALVHQHH
jgi:hypothetical protein